MNIETKYSLDLVRETRAEAERISYVSSYLSIPLMRRNRVVNERWERLGGSLPMVRHCGADAN